MMNNGCGESSKTGYIGPDGEKGDPGDVGERGINGRDGIDGIDGADGLDGILAGGLTGDVIVKNSNIDGDAEWRPQIDAGKF